jgi:hypothetical protein
MRSGIRLPGRSTGYPALPPQTLSITHKSASKNFVTHHLATFRLFKRHNKIVREEKMNEKWAENELASVDLGDKRLNDRLITLSKDFVKSPESPINQSCKDWASTKAAYRFFRNESVDYRDRCKEYSSTLAIQDTTYLTYSNHEKTIGLCALTKNRGKHKENIYTLGLIMHSTFAVSLDGLPLGLINQKIYSRPEETEERKELRKRTHNNALPIEEKDSYRWLESLKNTAAAFQHVSTRPVTVICLCSSGYYQASTGDQSYRNSL